MLESTNSYVKTKKSKPQKCPAQKDWTNSVGAYTSHQHEQSRTSTLSQSIAPLGFVVTPSMVQHGSTTMLVNLPSSSEASAAQPLMITQPVHLIQVSQVPSSSVPQSFIHVSSASQLPVMSTGQPQYHQPLSSS